MKYEVISADPPWFYNQRATWSQQDASAKTRFGGGASDTYTLMKDAELLALGESVKDVAADDAVLFMWATQPRLDFALEVMKAWGFTYKTTAFVWVKTNKDGSPATSPGYYTASNTEVVLLGTRGKTPRALEPAKKLINQVILAPRGEHSAKPEEMQDRIELMYPAFNKLEMFARRFRLGWLTIGNEIDGLDIQDVLPLIASELYPCTMEV